MYLSVTSVIENRALIPGLYIHTFATAYAQAFITSSLRRASHHVAQPLSDQQQCALYGGDSNHAGDQGCEVPSALAAERAVGEQHRRNEGELDDEVQSRVVIESESDRRTAGPREFVPGDVVGREMRQRRERDDQTSTRASITGDDPVHRRDENRNDNHRGDRVRPQLVAVPYTDELKTDLHQIGRIRGSDEKGQWHLTLRVLPGERETDVSSVHVLDVYPIEGEAAGSPPRARNA